MKLVEEVSNEKLRGGFYTSKSIVKFILRWASNGNKAYDILEPSCGDGAFLKQIEKQSFDYNSITAVEIVEEEAKKAKEKNLPQTEVLNKDFLTYCLNSSLEDQRFDLAIGNPPYIRYHYVPDEQHERAEKIFERADLDYSRLSNMWVSFVVGSCLMLRDKGKIGFVLPAGLLQISHTEPLRKFLSEFFDKISIISFEELVFPDIEQEVIVLLAERNDNGKLNIEHLEVRNESELKGLDVQKLKSPEKEINPKSDKWTFFFLDQEEIDLIERFHNNGMDKLGTYADVQVGMTTGYNKFFTVTKSTVEEYNLHKYAEKMVGRAVQVPSLIFTEEDWRENVEKGKRAYFLKFPSKDDLKEDALEYVKWGEEKEFDKGYKTGKREEWHVVPSTWVSDALFIRRNNIYPKLILNEANAFTTDTMHRVQLNNGVNEEALIASYYNSLSLAFAEISGRSHGGGALELMPNEAEEIRIPYNEDNAELLEEIDQMLREENGIDEIIDYTDEIILKERADLSDSDIETANNAWSKLRKRRLKRNNYS